MSVPDASIGDAAQCLRPWKVLAVDGDSAFHGPHRRERPVHAHDVPLDGESDDGGASVT
jgi:hypothetical protein